MQLYKEKEQAGKKEIQSIQLEEKWSTRKCNVGGETSKKRADAKLNERSSALRAGPTQLNPAACGKNRPRESSFLQREFNASAV